MRPGFLSVYAPDEMELKAKPEGTEMINGGRGRMRIVKFGFQLDVSLDLDYLMKLGWGKFIVFY